MAQLNKRESEIFLRAISFQLQPLLLSCLLLFTSDSGVHLLHPNPRTPGVRGGYFGFPFFIPLTTPDSRHCKGFREDLTTGHLRVVWLFWQKYIIYCSILSFSEPPKMNPVVEPLSWMLGTWLSDPPGVGTFPTLQPFQYLEEVHISHVGQPMLNFS